jgi:hypothetical protein
MYNPQCKILPLNPHSYQRLLSVLLIIVILTGVRSSSVCFWFAVPWWLMILNAFLYTCWFFVYIKEGKFEDHSVDLYRKSPLMIVVSNAATILTSLMLFLEKCLCAVYLCSNFSFWTTICSSIRELNYFFFHLQIIPVFMLFKFGEFFPTGGAYSYLKYLWFHSILRN